MKKLPYILLLLVVFACNDNIKPNLTSQLAGTYKLVENQSGVGKSVINLQLIPVDGTHLKMIFQNTVNFEGNSTAYNSYFTINKIPVSDESNFSYSGKVFISGNIAPGQYVLDVSGVLKTKVLTLVVNASSPDGSQNSSSTAVLIKD